MDGGEPELEAQIEQAFNRNGSWGLSSNGNEAPQSDLGKNSGVSPQMFVSPFKNHNQSQ